MAPYVISSMVEERKQRYQIGGHRCSEGQTWKRMEVKKWTELMYV